MPTDNPLRNLPAALEVLCARDGRQKREIAAAAGISPAMLSAYVTGRKEPSIESLGKLLGGLGVSLSTLGDVIAQVSAQQAGLPPSADLDALKAELLEVVDRRMAEFGYQPGGGKLPSTRTKSAKPKGRRSGKSRAH